MKVIVTGGSGFIGSCFVRDFIESQKGTILNIDKLTYSGNSESLKRIEKSNFYSFEKLDISEPIFKKNLQSDLKLQMILKPSSEKWRAMKNIEKFIEIIFRLKDTITEDTRYFINYDIYNFHDIFF